jgi:predicted Zn-dependent peptidase
LSGIQTNESDTTVATLPNGVRIVAIRMPHLLTASVSVFVRAGSVHETAALNGISHFVEHMVFKGTRERDARRVNLDAERLGTEVNAHTDKDHTAFHMSGLADHAPVFVRMLTDLVQHATFPQAELERERQVLLQEHAEDEDDPMAAAYRLFDRACFGVHRIARPVIGSRTNIERLGRTDLTDWVRHQYTGANVIVAAAGGLDPAAILQEANATLGPMARGSPNLARPASWVGGLRCRAIAGSTQTHMVLGFPIPGRSLDDPTGEVAAALFGEGMSSPLMAELRERRGLVYYAACSADVLEQCGQFVIEASFAPDKLVDVLREVMRLLVRHGDSIDSIDLERAFNQICVRELRVHERPMRRLEEAALDLFALDRVRSSAERLKRVQSVTAERLQTFFKSMITANVSVALTGRVGRRATEASREILRNLNSRVAVQS